MPSGIYAKLEKSANTDPVCLGTTVIYTIEVENIHTRQLRDVVFMDTIPTGLNFVPGSLEINGQPHPGADPNQSYPLPNIDPGVTVEVSFAAEATIVPTVNPVTNTAHIRFNTFTTENVPVDDATEYSNAFPITIRDCACDEDSCDQSVCKIYSISLPFTVKPFARKNTPSIICLDGIILSPGHVPCPSPQRDFDYTLTQRIRVELPVTFGAEVCYEEPCAEDDGECVVIP
ncbi:MAG: DUF11 domain-containing protein [Defluviitaleaceae bacterium]|nr:DUF11 domain-containing protein [Defluviitaleaceae bacterium]